MSEIIEARAAALAAARQYRDAHPAAYEEQVVAAAVDAFESVLIHHGILLSGNPGYDAELAAQRLGAASGHNLYAEDGWKVLLTEHRKVWHAYNTALQRWANEPDTTRQTLRRDRDILLEYTPPEQDNPQ